MSSPPVLLLCRLFPGTFTDVAHRFRLLDFYASALPIHAFLAAVAAHADPPRVVLVFGGGPIPVGAELFDAVPSLRCIITVSAGDRFVRRGLCPEQRGGDFLPLGSKIGGRRVGIIGLGSIGSAIARRLEAFGCVVSYHNRRRREDVAYAYFPTATDLAASSDVLVVACALTAETRRIVDRGVLDALGERGVVVNVARGANVDEAELVRALAEGRVAGAGLEVFDDEPNVPPELWAMDNVVLTPHQAIFTPESMADLSRVVLANLDAFFAGEPLLTRVKHRGGIPNPLPDCVPAVYDAIESVFQKTIDHSLTWCW
uniref:D-isomer specific 2-hydroxyacid dehydrogenase NAD-binding domain-containing protein n=1 Tax=Oryza barthii TaxID=65489 RepID=A0A0D3FRV1_9ORYZ